MKLTIRLHAGVEGLDHQLQLWSPETAQAGGGQLQFRIDGETGEADYAEIATDIYSILVDGRSYEVRVTGRHDEPSEELHAGTYIVSVGTHRYPAEVLDPRRRRHAGSAAPLEGRQDILAPMPGKIVRILVSENREVARGQGLLVIEAMKMQNELRASRPGRVEKIYVREGTSVETGFKLLRLA